MANDKPYDDETDTRPIRTHAQLLDQFRLDARARELASDEAAGHREEGGISPFSVPYATVKFDPN